MTAAPQSIQPEAAPVRQNGEFYVSDGIVCRAPVHTKTATGTNISMGFPVCEPSEYTDADNLAACLNEHVTLQARVEDLTKALEEITAAFEGLRPMPLILDAMASGLIANARRALALPLEQRGTK